MMLTWSDIAFWLISFIVVVGVMRLYYWWTNR